MASSSSSVMSVLVDPEYIQFLLDPELEFSCYFVVGNPKLATVEKIGVIRKMLAAHSEVFRTQLLSRQWKSEKPEEVTDIQPATFKNLLRFVYGFDTTADMGFDDADDLLYVADRYIMDKLKRKLATRLMSLLDYTNICSLLTNPACSRVLELHSDMTKILQTQTDRVLACPQFLRCCPETFVTILEQEVMNVPELEVWRAAVTWARNKVKENDTKSLREHLEKPLQHIRVCTIPFEEIGSEVIPTGVLSNEEVGAVCTSVATKKKPKTLTSVCNNMEVRRTTASSKNSVVECVKSAELCVDLCVKAGWEWGGYVREWSFSLHTREVTVEVTRLECVVNRGGTFTMTVRLAAVNTSDTVTAVITHTGNSTVNILDNIPISTEDRSVVLSPHTKYNITVTSCDTQFSVWTHTSPAHRETHFDLEFPPLNDRYGSPLRGIVYKTLTPQ